MTQENKEVQEKSQEELAVERVAALEAQVAELKAQKEVESEKKKEIVKSQSTYTRNTSNEKMLMNSFRVKNLSDLIKVNTAHRNFARVPADLKMQVMTLKENIDTARFMEQIFGNGQPDTKAKFGAVSFNSTDFGREIMDQIKAFGSTVSGGGSEWVPTMIATTAIEEYELERTLSRMFQQVNMPSNPYSLPVQSGSTSARKIAENTGMTDNSFTTSEILFQAFKLGEYYRIPEELQEDSAVDFLRMARLEVIRAQERAYEQLILNGDDSTPHMDNDTDGGAADLAEKSVKGIRKLSIDNGATVDFGGNAVSKAKLDEMRRLMSKFGVNVRELLYEFSPVTYFQAVEIPEVTTVDQFGPAATILDGALAAYRGVKVGISEYCRDDVSATGVNTLAGPNTTGLCHLINTMRFYFAKRRPIVVKAQMDLPDQDRWLLASYSRVDFKGHAQSGSEVSAVTGINIGL